MKKIIFASIVIFISCAFTPSAKKKVIFFGDSITELGVKKTPRSGTGYILQMDSLLQREKKADEFELIGSGISANKVYDLYLRLEDDVLNKNPDIVFIYVGVNDVWHKTLLGTGTDPDKFEKFYQAIINKMKVKNIKVILVTPAVVGEKTDMSNPLDGDLNKYSNMIRELARKNDLALVDLRKKIQDYLKDNNSKNEDKNILTYDGVHMNQKGNLFLAELMLKALK